MKLGFLSKKEEPLVIAPVGGPGVTPTAQSVPVNNPLKRLIKPVLKVILFLVIAVVAYSLWQRSGIANAGASVEVSYTHQEVERGTIVQSISSSGSLAPADSYTVTSTVAGEILFANFEEGDMVLKDSVLFELDSSDTANNIERAEISLTQAQRNYDNTVARQYLYSDYTGMVHEILVEVGDKISMNQTVAVLQDRSSMTLEVYFPSDDADSFYIGQSAHVVLQGTFEVLDATVEKIASHTESLLGNRIVKTVTLSVPNLGGLGETTVATATIDGVGSADSGTFSYRDAEYILAENAGEITSISISEGSMVYKNNLVLRLGGSDMEDAIQTAAESLRTTELSTESTQDQLDYYTIESPISGTVVEKSMKQGDNANAGSLLCIIYDLAYLEMIMSIDELDISQIQVGQTVELTADAVEGRTYYGTITKVSVAGTAVGGITTYPVTVRVEETDGLLPGMNVNAEIVVAEATDILKIPNSMIERGNIVMITADSPSAVNALTTEAPEGYVYIPVTLGMSDNDYAEITSGLQLGDVVALEVVTYVMNQIMMPGVDQDMMDARAEMESEMREGLQNAGSVGGRG